MKKFIENYFLLALFLLLISGLVVVCIYIETPQKNADTNALSRILKKKKIRFITDNNGNAYYTYRGESMGFEYELARAFADFLDVELEVLTPGWNSMISMLETGKGDFIGAALTITQRRQVNLLFSQPYMQVQQQLIYHKTTPGIKTLEDLKGKTVHVRRNTSYHDCLEKLKESGIDLNIALLDNTPSEEIIGMVAAKKIDYTVADSNIAQLNRRYYPDIVIGMAIKGVEFLGWAVNPREIKLMDRINLFFYSINKTGYYQKLVQTYYGNLDNFDYFDVKKFHKRLETRFPKYRKYIIQESFKYGFDWRIVAALVYQESHFDPLARSFTGVRGLMQVTASTAREMGISNRLNPVQSLRAGIKYLHVMYQKFDDIEDPDEKLLFAIGSYNVGYGHVRDAQRLAIKESLDPLKWASLEKTLPLLSKRKYYRKTRHGYARGWEPVRHVQQILMYYDILKKKLAPPEEKRIIPHQSPGADA
ncbi:membrane-bound lytic murein transglycosylase MltF [Desulfocicer vacuolatum]|uniref:membrane-bound lytic murein transglycosylase MltF n=1 Tax=Desulfocicer vacuolatum TaxID=2298 RepID=UPI0009FCA74C|nr:membrane-bound lytic murein transglycosylase MltF [Desulfocicer vacuolatum]